MMKKENNVEVSINNDNIEDIKKCDKNMIFSKFFSFGSIVCSISDRIIHLILHTASSNFTFCISR